MYPIETKRAKSFLQRLRALKTLLKVIKRRFLARLCFLLLSIILSIFSFNSNIKHGVLSYVEYVKDKWITFMVSSRLVSAAEYRFRFQVSEDITSRCMTLMNYLNETTIRLLVFSLDAFRCH